MMKLKDEDEVSAGLSEVFDGAEPNEIAFGASAAADSVLVLPKVKVLAGLLASVVAPKLKFEPLAGAAGFAPNWDSVLASDGDRE